jgi:hypothetical protein
VGAYAGPETALLACPVFEVFFGGARGGGKTDGMLGEWASHAALHGKNAVGLMIRRERCCAGTLSSRSTYENSSPVRASKPRIEASPPSTHRIIFAPARLTLIQSVTTVDFIAVERIHRRVQTRPGL